MYKKFLVRAFTMVDGHPCNVYARRFGSIDQCVRVCCGFLPEVSYSVYDTLLEKFLPISELVDSQQESEVFYDSECL